MYDAVIIGGGPGGYVAALKGAQLGGKMAIVESGRLGGTCLNRGCIPTKALVRAAEVYQTAQDAPDYGVTVGEVSFDLGLAMKRKNLVVDQLVGGIEQLMRSYGIDVYVGHGDVPEPGRVSVKDTEGNVTEIATRNVVLATGAVQLNPPLSEESLALTITSDEALTLDRVPKSLIVIGGGVLGVEFACIYNAFGAKVDIIELQAGILPAIDEELSRRLIPIFRRKGIGVNTRLAAKEILQADDGEKIVVCSTSSGEEKRFKAETVLIATGMRPNFGGIDLEALGVIHDRKGIKVDEHMQTNVSGIWAIGDVLGTYYLAPVASFEGVVAMENIFGHKTKMDYTIIPNCVFSIPEVAGVGLKESEAKAAGHRTKVSKFPFSANGRAVAIGEAHGLVKIVADADDDTLLGMHILGPHADDLIHEGAIALKLKAKSADIAGMIHAHPTLPEAVMEASLGILSDPFHLAKRR